MDNIITNEPNCNNWNTKDPIDSIEIWEQKLHNRRGTKSEINSFHFLWTNILPKNKKPNYYVYVPLLFPKGWKQIPAVNHAFYFPNNSTER